MDMQLRAMVTLVWPCLRVDHQPGMERESRAGSCHTGTIRFPVRVSMGSHTGKHHHHPWRDTVVTDTLSHTMLGAMTVVHLQHGHPAVPERRGCSGSGSGGCTAVWPPLFHFANAQHRGWCLGRWSPLSLSIPLVNLVLF